MIRRFIFRCALVTLALIAGVAPTLAQDSAQVLRVSVGFGTLKNTPRVIAKLTPEARAEIERLEAAARKANGEGKYGDALKHMYHGMALMRGTDWTPARALGTSLTVKLDRQVVDPSDAVTLKVGQLFSLDEKPAGKIAATIALMKLRGDDVIK